MNMMNLLFLGSNIIGGADGPTSIMVTSGFEFAALALVLCLVGLAERVLFAVAAYNDACSRDNSDAVMWGLLIGFLGVIPGIIYLCVRNSGRSFATCQNCGCSHYAGDHNCPRCGAPNQTQQFVNPLAAQQAHRAKVLMWIALVLLAISLVVTIVGIMIFAANIYSIANGPNGINFNTEWDIK
jgi:heme/copper-type cytochrome/quinol oxidase subunit 2